MKAFHYWIALSVLSFASSAAWIFVSQEDMYRFLYFCAHQNFVTLRGVESVCFAVTGIGAMLAAIGALGKKSGTPGALKDAVY